MSLLKKPFKRLKALNHSSDSNNTTDSVPSKTEGIHSDVTTGSSSNTTPPNGNVTNGNVANRHATNENSPVNSRYRSRENMEEEKKRPSMDKEHQEVEMKKRGTMTLVEDEKFIQECPPELSELCRPYSMNMSKKLSHENRILFKDIDFESKSFRTRKSKMWLMCTEMEGKIISFRARIHTLRRMSAKLVFIIFRQQTMTIQGVLQSSKNYDDLQRMRKILAARYLADH
jgi:hypothetical protein